MRTLRAVLPVAMLASAVLGVAQERTNRDQSHYTELHDPGFPIKSGLTIVPAARAALRDDDIVLGVVVGGEARAYPVNLMWEPLNETLNDTVGGAAIAATWCPIAHSGVVYDRALDGGTADLGAVGLEKGVFVLYDRQTGSRWSQVSGRATSGRLEGRVLRKRDSTVTTWGRWRELHPDTTVYVDAASPDAGASPRSRWRGSRWEATGPSSTRTSWPGSRGGARPGPTCCEGWPGLGS